MWDQLKAYVDHALQEVEPIKKIENNPWYPLEPRHHFRKIVYSIVVCFHTLWVMKGFYGMVGLFTSDIGDFEFHEVGLVFVSRFIGVLLQLCGTLYFIQRLLGRASTALVESVTKNYNYLQLFNIGATSPVLLLGMTSSILNGNGSALKNRSVSLIANTVYAAVHLLVCDIFLSWPEDESASPGSARSGSGMPSMDKMPSLNKMPSLDKMPNLENIEKDIKKSIKQNLPKTR